MWASCRINSDSGCSVTGTWVYGSRPSLGVSGCRWLWPSRRYQRRGTVARTCFPACRLEFKHTHSHAEEDKSLMPLEVRGLGFSACSNVCREVASICWIEWHHLLRTSPSFPFSILNWFMSCGRWKSSNPWKSPWCCFNAYQWNQRFKIELC